LLLPLLEVQAKHSKAKNPTAAKEPKNRAFVYLGEDVHLLAIPCLVFSDKYIGNNALPAVTPADKTFSKGRGTEAEA
jgi:hypothetical protein